MSVLTEYVKKVYADSLPDQRAHFDIAWTAAASMAAASSNRDYDRGFFNGYAHSLYFPLDRRDYGRLYEKLFSDDPSNSGGHLRLFTAYANENRIKFCRFDGQAPEANVPTATVYETMTIEDTQVYTMENANLVYSVDKVARIRDRLDLSAGTFVDADDTFAANGHWCHKMRAGGGAGGGVLYLGRHYTRPKFKFPVSQYVRHKFNAPPTIEKTTLVGSDSSGGDDDDDDATTIDEIGKRNLTFFVLFLVYDTSAFLWNRESLSRFIKHLELSAQPDDYDRIRFLNRAP